MLILLLCLADSAFAQDWMSGYSYRKKITVNKLKVVATELSVGTSVIKQDLVNFPVLVELQDNDLIHIPGSCSNKIKNAEGRDISFALTSSANIPLNFQLEKYDPVTGRLTCWIRIDQLSANGTGTVATSFYLYYGSVLLHDPFGPGSANVWSGDFSRIWHLKRDLLPAICRDAQSGLPSQDATGSTDVDSTNFVDAKIGTGVRLNGSSQSFYSGTDTSSAITISAWINLNAVGTEQVIVANDSTNAQFRNGYSFKINAAGKLVMTLYRSLSMASAISSAILDPNKWYHVVAMISGTQISLILNGVKVGGTSNIKLGNGGSIRIGSSKQYGNYYSGIIDELRIQKMVKHVEWLKTQYVNQDNPSVFCTVFEEEYSPSEFSKFVGPANGQWNVAANWSSANIPTAGSNIIIPAGKSVLIAGSGQVAINKLMVKAGAALFLANNLEISCSAQIDSNASIKLADRIRLRCSGNVINDGSILSDQTLGTLVFSGNSGTQFFSGRGTTSVYQLENEQSLNTNELILKSHIHVSGFVNLIRGILNSNSNLTLLAADELNAAAILPVPLYNASITGDVNVQQYVSGSYPAPATARGWRLLASPVHNGITGILKEYNLLAFKNSMFMTGPGGVINGFDPSPLNNGTVYTHDQSLPGTLSQKYTTISNVNARVSIGKGVYIFSRGSRMASGAYFNQIQQAPFANPDSYRITHTGKVYLGDLSVELTNKNTGAEGDGFNLLGNPYPAGILWGNLIKTNLSSYIWLYDPLNKDYKVSDAANTIIPAGNGFFVRVNAGYTTGSLTFSEDSKYVPSGANSAGQGSRLAYADIHAKNTAVSDHHIITTLTRNAFSQQYKINFDEGGNNSIDNDDALKIGEGYVNIAGQINNNKLAIEQRSSFKEQHEIKLYIRGWESGTYTMSVKITAALLKSISVKLIDSYLNQETKLKDSVTLYSFKIDLQTPKTQESDRFKIKIAPYDNKPANESADEITIYPNPVIDKLHFRTGASEVRNVRITFTDILGRIIARHDVKLTQSECSVECMGIPKGIYIVGIYETSSNRIIKSFKIIKE